MAITLALLEMDFTNTKKADRGKRGKIKAKKNTRKFDLKADTRILKDALHLRTPRYSTQKRW